MKDICKECRWNNGCRECHPDYKKKAMEKGKCKDFEFPDYG